MITKIISGGQTGADRAGLDAAIELGIEHGGWCPKGRRSEDGTIPLLYKLQETEEYSYNKRTKLNVENSHGTVIVCSMENRNSAGTVLTEKFLKELDKPYIKFFTNGSIEIYKNALAAYIHREGIKVLNVAGNRESVSPGVYEFTKKLIIEAINVLKATEKNSTI